MGVKVSDPGGGDFELPEAGTYSARCYRVIDLGTQHNERFNKDARQVVVSWELIGTEMQSDPESRPFTMHQTYTASLHEKAKLRQHLESWRGRAFTDKELAAFDLDNILGKPCLLGVVHKKTESGKTFANVSAVMAVPKGQPEIGSLVNPCVSFDLDAPDWKAYDELSDRMKERIQASPEYQAHMGEAPPPPSDDDAPPAGDDGIPF